MTGPPQPRRRSPLPKYLVLQTPGWFLASAVLGFFVWRGDLSRHMGVLLFGLWILKDFVLYPILKRSYEDGSPNGADGLIGALGTARERLDPEGYVRVGSELWRAVLANGHDPVEAGAAVRVLEVRQLTLRVEPA
ncbi:MAG: NfeD family protein [Myxococcota bacterium]